MQAFAGEGRTQFIRPRLRTQTVLLTSKENANVNPLVK